MVFASVDQDPLCRPLPEFKGPQFSHSVTLPVLVLLLFFFIV